MKSLLHLAALLLSFSAALAAASPAAAGHIVTLEVVGVDLAASPSGLCESLPDPSATSSAILRNRVIAGSAHFGATDLVSGSAVNLNSFDFSANFPEFGTNSPSIADTSRAGTLQPLVRPTVRLLPSYTLGTEFFGVLTWAEQSFATMAITPGSYVGTLSGLAETVTVNEVPEPLTWAFIAGFLTALVLLRRRGAR